MAVSPDFEFVSELARDLSKGDIELPSFPDIVIRIRELLAKDDVLIEQVSQAVSNDAVLVSRLLVFANSSHHNPAGVHIDSLDLAISRLGFDLVRNTAVSLAMKQMFIADQHRALLPALRGVWTKSMQLAAMASAIAADRGGFNADTAFLCGLLHEVGKLYILSRAGKHAEFLGDADALEAVLADWHPKVGTAIAEAWQFPENIVRTLDPAEHKSEFTHEEPTLVDVVYVADELLPFAEADETDETDEEALAAVLAGNPAFVRLQMESGDLAPLCAAYRERLEALQDSLTA